MAKKDRLEDKILDVDARMQGTVVFKDPVNLRINGSFEGTLDTRGSLMIGENANVHADIKGDKIVVAGKINGNLIASSSLTLVAPAIVTGDVQSPLLSVAEGAIIEGRITMLNLVGVGDNETLSLRDVAQYLEVEARTVEEWVSQKKIPAEFRDGQWWFNRTAIDRWIHDEKIKL